MAQRVARALTVAVLAMLLLNTEGTTWAGAGSSPWSVTPGPESIAVTWLQYASGEFLTVKVSGAGSSSGCTSAKGSCTVTGLTDGATYAVTAVVTSGSAGTTVATLTTTAIPFTTPGAPLAHVVAGDRRIDVSWSAPASDGGSPIHSYVARAALGGSSVTCTTSTRSCVLSGLRNGSVYEVTVIAANAAGDGPPSTVVTAVPAGLPGVVRDVRSARSVTDLPTLRWVTPLDDGGRAVIGFRVRYAIVGSARWVAVPGESGMSVAGADPRQRLRFEVAAVTSVGVGPWSSPVTVAPMIVSTRASSVVVTPTSSPVGGRAELKIHARDDRGRSVPDRRLVVRAGSRLVATVITSGAGDASVSVTRTAAGRVTYSVTDGVQGSILGTASVSWTPGPSRSVQIEVLREKSGARLIRIHVHDRFGNAEAHVALTLRGAGDEHHVTSDARGAANVLVHGVGSVTYTLTSATSVPRTILVVFPAMEQPHVAIAFNLGVGLQLGRYRVHVQGRGLNALSGQWAMIQVHSRAVVVARVRIGADGTFSDVVRLPPSLEDGAHVLTVSVARGDVVGHRDFVVGADVLTRFGLERTPLDGYAPFVPDQHSGHLLELSAALVAIAAAVGARSRRRDREVGNLVDVEVERFGVAAAATARGATMRRWLERWSHGAPHRYAKVSPVIGRVTSDGDYLRAAMGPWWVPACAGAVALGVASSAQSSFFAVPPPTPWLVALVAIGVLDAGWGVLAGVGWLAPVVFLGHWGNVGEVRGSLGVVLLCFVVPLAAGSIAPLRRPQAHGRHGAWQHASDLVTASLFGAFVALEMARALGPLFGVELPGVVRPGLVALTAMGVVVVRMVVEWVVQERSTERLARMVHAGDLESGPVQMVASLAAQVGLFWFVADGVVGRWTLIAATVVLFLPLIAGLREWDAVSWIRDHWSDGSAKWTLIIAVSGLLAWALEHLGLTPAQILEVGFVVLCVPVSTSWALELYAGEGGVDGARSTLAPVARRCVGAAAIGGAVWLVVAQGVGV